jgi:hypothetical protein
MPATEPHFQKNRRSLRKLLIYPRFQLPLIGINLLALALSFVVLWAVSEKAIGDLAPAASLSGTEVEFFRRYLHYQAMQIHLIFFIGGAISLALSAFVTLYLSHRIAGPMVALRTYFRNMQEGVEPLPPLQFRDPDFLSDIPPLVNGAVDALCQRLQPPSSRRKRA